MRLIETRDSWISSVCVMIRASIIRICRLSKKKIASSFDELAMPSLHLMAPGFLQKVFRELC